MAYEGVEFSLAHAENQNTSAVAVSKLSAADDRFSELRTMGSSGRRCGWSDVRLLVGVQGGG